MGGAAGAAVRESAPPAIACRYCRTGAALNRPTGKPHDEGCTTARDLPTLVNAALERQVRDFFCQGCGERQALDPVLWALNVSSLLPCDRCDRWTRHHPAPPDIVAAELCLCGVCRTRRKFDEDEAAVGRRRAA